MEHLTITDPQVRGRLADTAEYLGGLRDEQFTMLLYSRIGRNPIGVLTTEHDNCGCIAGHVPKIASELTMDLANEKEDESNKPLTWHGRAEAFIRQEGVDERTAEVLFNAAGERVDNTRRAAVEQIRIASHDGVPPAFAETPWLNPVHYARDHPGAPGVPRAQDA